MGKVSTGKRKAGLARVVSTALAIVWALCIFIFSSIPADSLPAFLNGWFGTLLHAIEFCILGGLVTVALCSPRIALWKAALIALALSAFYALTDVMHLFLGAGHPFDAVLLIVEIIGALVGAVVIVFVISRRRVIRSRASNV